MALGISHAPLISIFIRLFSFRQLVKKCAAQCANNMKESILLFLAPGDGTLVLGLPGPSARKKEKSFWLRTGVFMQNH